ncbi:3'-5' exonuclease [Persicirhabdus sediminis]|uniref:3'-5' exonuclease n=1 Tax=Persicirhabdus sediminis TaxID=454144 RepID=A0A8J7ME96_9BACT|nr:3'-5' exonuclease [Persicirhabdus sediminis]MBK1791412.1 3'-5' exonuclease domain-containing protein 2 [Persicirhabdus sediminis]
MMQDNDKAGAKKKPNKTTRPTAPTKAETAQYPPFPGLSPSQIIVPKTPAECDAAVKEMMAAGTLGFDTEAKPTFRAGEKSQGPHVVQFALADKAYIFQLHLSCCEKAASELIAAEHVCKVGFGLKNDRGQILHRLGITLTNELDLDLTFRKMGYRGQIGVRGAIGVLLGQGFKKSKSTTTSNWAKKELTQSQLLYAANDAFAALVVMHALQEQGQLELK